jgi:isoleucyl-tRNA synthetase
MDFIVALGHGCVQCLTAAVCSSMLNVYNFLLLKLYTFNILEHTAAVKRVQLQEKDKTIVNELKRKTCVLQVFYHMFRLFYEVELVFNFMMMLFKF